jgi:hypothetical protein
MLLSSRIAIAATLLLTACSMGGGSSTGSRRTSSAGTATTTTTSTTTSTNTGTGTVGVPRSVVISWNANREKAVNSAGGGYRVYYSTLNNFSTTGASAVSAPYASGSTAPTSAIIPSLPSGTYYYRVVAYSALNPAGNQSDQNSFVVP